MSVALKDGGVYRTFIYGGLNEILFLKVRLITRRADARRTLTHTHTHTHTSL